MTLPPMARRRRWRYRTAPAPRRCCPPRPPGVARRVYNTASRRCGRARTAMAAIEEADPATRRTLADPAEAVGRPAGQVWHCEHECGFTGSYSAVILHEGACAVGEVGRPPTPRPRASRTAAVAVVPALGRAACSGRGALNGRGSMSRGRGARPSTRAWSSSRPSCSASSPRRPSRRPPGHPIPPGRPVRWSARGGRGGRAI